MTKEIARLIVIAQASSDAGKGITDLLDLLKPELYKKAQWGYPEKDKAIYSLLCLLSRNPQKDVHFYVCKDVDKIADFIIYFDFMLDQSKVQVSFHSYDKRVKRFVHGSRKSCTDWRSDLESRKMAYRVASRNGFLSRSGGLNTGL